MDKNTNMNIPKEKFRLIHEGERIHDKKFEDKPVGYFRDAWIRFRKSRASVVAAIIIICIILYAVVAPWLITTHDGSFMVNQYSKKPARVTALRDSIGIMDGGVNRQNINEAELIRLSAIGIGAADGDGHGATLAEGLGITTAPLLSRGSLRSPSMPRSRKSTSMMSVWTPIWRWDSSMSASSSLSCRTFWTGRRRPACRCCTLW